MPIPVVHKVVQGPKSWFAKSPSVKAKQDSIAKEKKFKKDVAAANKADTEMNKAWLKSREPKKPSKAQKTSGKVGGVSRPHGMY